MLIEAMFGLLILSFTTLGFLEIQKLEISRRNADIMMTDIRQFQGALIRHHRENPQDGVEGWVAVQYETPGDDTSPVVWQSLCTEAPEHMPKLGFAFGEMNSHDGELGLRGTRTIYNTIFNVLADGQTSTLRLEFDVPNRLALANLLNAGLTHMIIQVDPIPTPVDPEDTTYSVQLHLSPGLPRITHSYVLDSSGQDGMQSPMAWQSTLTARGDMEEQLDVTCEIMGDGGIVVGREGFLLSCGKETAADSRAYGASGAMVTAELPTIQPEGPSMNRSSRPK